MGDYGQINEANCAFDCFLRVTLRWPGSGAGGDDASFLRSWWRVPADDTKAPAEKGGQGTDTRLTDVDGTLTQGAKGSGKSTTPGDQPPGDVSGPVAGGGGITGASTSVISREDIERSPQATLADIISRAAGVQTSSFYGGVNGVGTTIDLRGFGVTGASNTLILINGRRQNDWDLPGFDLSTIAKEFG